MDVSSLKTLISSRLGSGKKITNIESSVSDLQGNVSLMVKLKVTVEDQNGKEEALHLVAKKLPEDEDTKQAFDIQVTFKKEVKFYDVILPALKKFSDEEGVTDISENFAKFYGARFNLHGTSDVVDNNGLIILEDLCARGFGNGNSVTGFDLNTAEVILKNLANFHGTVIALKHKKADIFEQQIKPLITPFNFPKGDIVIHTFKILREVIQSFPEYAGLAEKATNFPEKQTPTTVRALFSCITHEDLWISNIMYKTGLEKEVENVLVDFQLFGYRSSVADVFFFLWSSVKEEVIKHKIDHLLEHYYLSLLNRLEDFGLDTSPFSYEKFEEELRMESDYEFGHSLMFVCYLRVVPIRKEDFESKKYNLKVSDFSPESKNFLHFMLEECVKRRWLC